jgi:hypothetical protein
MRCASANRIFYITINKNVTLCLLITNLFNVERVYIFIKVILPGANFCCTQRTCLWVRPDIHIASVIELEGQDHTQVLFRCVK